MREKKVVALVICLYDSVGVSGKIVVRKENSE